MRLPLNRPGLEHQLVGLSPFLMVSHPLWPSFLPASSSRAALNHLIRMGEGDGICPPRESRATLVCTAKIQYRFKLTHSFKCADHTVLIPALFVRHPRNRQRSFKSRAFVRKICLHQSINNLSESWVLGANLFWPVFIRKIRSRHQTNRLLVWANEIAIIP